ncbi:MAG: hypothetical protein ACYDCG_03325 [Candidatus Acidiferrales bacterium]
MNECLRFLRFCLILTVVRCEARDAADLVILSPKLHVGQIIRYQIGYRATTNTNTESTVAAPMAPTGGQMNANILLQVEVEDLRKEAGETLARLRTRIVAADAIAPNAIAPANPTPDSNGAGKSGMRDKTVELTLHSDGQVTDVQGLDKLSADERAAWQEWVARFGGAAAFPEKGVKPGEKWKSDEPIPNSLLAGLSWEKESEYVNDAPCAAMQRTPQGVPAAGQQQQETCAVILTTAILKQKSSPKDATPQDYKLHDLRNMGTAQGKNQIISYFSLKTGLVVRATEDANQSMNLTVATADGSNRVHYAIDAESHARVLLLADESANHP